LPLHRSRLGALIIDCRRKLRDSYFVRVERLKAYDEDFARQERQGLLCEVYFGAEVRAPLDELLRVRGRVIGAARRLLASASGSPIDPAELAELRRCEATIWDYGDFDDEIRSMVDKAVTTIERTLRPYVRS
jgi:hypothetical protein